MYRASSSLQVAADMDGGKQREGDDVSEQSEKNFRTKINDRKLIN
jgi:hypothetical protein